MRLPSGLDYIIVDNNDKFDAIIDWYEKNSQTFDLEFKIPFVEGVIEYREENIATEFHVKDDVVIFSVFVSQNSKNEDEWAKIYDFQYNYITEEFGEEIYSNQISPQALQKLKIVNALNNTSAKQVNKFLLIMKFACYYENIIEVKEVKERKLSKREQKTIRRYKNNHIVQFTKVYRISESSPNDFKRTDGKRSYTACDYEFDVKGHWRHNKNGTRTWVKPYSKNKGKDHKNKTYKL